MSYLKIVVLFSSLFLLSCCSEKDCCAPAPYEHNVSMMVVDNEGNDLLDPNNSNGFNHTAIRVYEIYEGDTTLIQKGIETGMYGFVITSPRGRPFDKYVLEVIYAYLPNWKVGSENAKVLIQWNDTKSAILDAKFEKIGTTSYLTQIDYNGKKVWEADGSSNYHFEVIEN